MKAPGPNRSAKPIPSDVFWGLMPPCEHMVQIYQDEDTFLENLEGFVAGGLMNGEGVIVIATAPHLAALEDRLREGPYSLNEARAHNQYFGLEANETLARFMVDGRPDDSLFQTLLQDLMPRVRQGGRRVRAFGEMVAVLWEQGNKEAVFRLEHLWQDVCEREKFSLFCAYPKSGFTLDAETSIQEICAAHSRLRGSPRSYWRCSQRASMNAASLR